MARSMSGFGSMHPSVRQSEWFKAGYEQAVIDDTLRLASLIEANKLAIEVIRSLVRQNDVLREDVPDVVSEDDALVECGCGEVFLWWQQGSHKLKGCGLNG